jgi:hypothetical protein
MTDEHLDKRRIDLVALLQLEELPIIAVKNILAATAKGTARSAIVGSNRDIRKASTSEANDLAIRNFPRVDSN